jgi:hypothetical protein
MFGLTHAKNLASCEFRFWLDRNPDCFHADHHATSKAAMPTPMTAAVTQSIIKFSVSGFIGFFRLSE